MNLCPRVNLIYIPHSTKSLVLTLVVTARTCIVIQVRDEDWHCTTNAPLPLQSGWCLACVSACSSWRYFPFALPARSLWGWEEFLPSCLFRCCERRIDRYGSCADRSKWHSLGREGRRARTRCRAKHSPIFVCDQSRYATRVPGEPCILCTGVVRGGWPPFVGAQWLSWTKSPQPLPPPP